MKFPIRAYVGYAILVFLVVVGFVGHMLALLK